MNKRLLSLLITILILSNSIISFGENLGLSGESYVLIDEISGRILIEKNPHQKMAMASTTKIMTALVAIENCNLDEKVVIEKDSTNIEGSSIYLEEGEILSLKDLLYGLILRSGNDSAVAIAKHVGKTEKKFIDLMNNKAKEIGALNTNFTNPHGLSEKGHYSTAYDLALITREALKYKAFREIFMTKSYDANRVKNNYFINKNKTLWEYEGGDGGKTGYTMEAGRCLVSSAKRNEMRLIAVSLNAYDWFNDNYKLLDYGFENFKPYIIYDKNQFMGNINIEDGEDYVNLVVENELIYPLTAEESSKIKLFFPLDEDIYPPIRKGDKIGVVETYLDGVLIKKENLIANNYVRKTNLIDKLMKSIRNLDNN
ncbi:D-alanyl-D-alanine carboxypeptidase family protein [Wansuia hejianensis]|uniref:serine-type D-Ala-D-Ala carboxypeptidase n=1 Tax=Wansuia hejianensis TaxID=2763667 RepID=A0A926EVC5_9FIRM|nr:D-alanyl-D-alanine carboxypeptidase family protein [Wansuia hejianensis]MBC8590553.1 D-alanyl-D-alanine carboxypeptidase [Wansuia hejianensis]